MLMRKVDTNCPGLITQPSSVGQDVPLFLVPGIFGHPSDYQALILNVLQNGHARRPIYVYSHPSLSAKKPSYGSLNNLSEAIAEEIDKITNHPVTLIVGYSYGCSLAALAAQYLTNKGRECKLFLIDGPSPECSQNYFKTEIDSAKYDLVSIAQYAAQLSSRSIFNNGNAPLLSDLIEINHTNDPVAVMDTLQSIISKKMDLCRYDITFFHTYMSIAREGIQFLTRFTPNPLALKINSISLLYTEETRKKYHSHTASEPWKYGWDEYAREVHLVANDASLYNATHINIIKDPKNALTNALCSFIKDSLQPYLSSYVERGYRELPPDGQLQFFTRIVHELPLSYQLEFLTLMLNQLKQSIGHESSPLPPSYEKLDTLLNLMRTLTTAVPTNTGNSNNDYIKNLSIFAATMQQPSPPSLVNRSTTPPESGKALNFHS